MLFARTLRDAPIDPFQLLFVGDTSLLAGAPGAHAGPAPVGTTEAEPEFMLTAGRCIETHPVEVIVASGAEPIPGSRASRYNSPPWRRSR